MKEILISIKPQFVEKILNGDKTIEIRKTKPNCELPVKVYIYCTKKGGGLISRTPQTSFNDIRVDVLNGRVVAEFTLSSAVWTCGWRLKGNTGRVAKRTQEEFELPSKSCMTIDDIVVYAGGDNRMVYMWNIENLKIYDKPKELSEFTVPNPDVANLGSLYGSVDRSKYPLRLPLEKAPQSWCYVKNVQDI